MNARNQSWAQKQASCIATDSAEVITGRLNVIHRPSLLNWTLLSGYWHKWCHRKKISLIRSTLLCWLCSRVTVINDKRTTAKPTTLFTTPHRFGLLDTNFILINLQNSLTNNAHSSSSGSDPTLTFRSRCLRPLHWLRSRLSPPFAIHRLVSMASNPFPFLKAFRTRLAITGRSRS